MNKKLESMRNNLVENTMKERILESSSVELTRELNKKETSIYLCICELVSSGKLNVGWQFGIKRFNTLFTNWENKKATEKTSVIPTAADIANACKYFYKVNAKELGFMPIVRMNNDGTIIIDCVSFVENFYSKPTEKKTSVSREKALKNIFKCIDALNTAINDSTPLLNSSDATDILNTINNMDLIKALQKAKEKKSVQKVSA